MIEFRFWEDAWRGGGGGGGGGTDGGKGGGIFLPEPLPVQCITQKDRSFFLWHKLQQRPCRMESNCIMIALTKKLLKRMIGRVVITGFWLFRDKKNDRNAASFRESVNREYVKIQNRFSSLYSNSIFLSLPTFKRRRSNAWTCRGLLFKPSPTVTDR